MQDTTGVAEQLTGLLREQTPAPESLSVMEAQMRALTLEVQRQALELWLAQLVKSEERPSSVACECGQTAVYQRQRTGFLRTLFGEVRYERSYFLCAACHSGTYPLDIRLGLRPNAISAEVERLSGLAQYRTVTCGLHRETNWVGMGVQMAFEKGSEVFGELTLRSLSDQTLDKATQAYGAEVLAREAEWQQAAYDGEELLRRKREEKPPRRLYGAIDGLKTPIRKEKEDDEAWRELKIGAWFVARGQPPNKPDGDWRIKAEQLSYYADYTPANEFAKLVWTTAVQRHVQLAQELIILGDGAKWIWDLVQTHFPQAIQIVDWFHACEYLAPLAKVAFSEKQKQRDWITEVKSALWQGRLDDVIAACRQHINPNRENDPAHKAVTYYTNNRSRMDYPAYRAQGYQIGSGTVESAAKQIGQQRLKIAGARWNLQSARLVAKARAAFLSGQWLELAARRTHLPLAV